jgi:hypothetical protein
MKSEINKKVNQAGRCIPVAENCFANPAAIQIRSRCETTMINLA